jgi:4-carboxymuconolactone decarboxylase
MDRLEKGRDLLTDMMGRDFMERRDARRNSFNATIQDYSDEVCFGTVWSRSGLDRKTRSMLNVAMLTALYRPSQLRTHVESAIKNGCTAEEIREIILHAAVYAGLPSSVEGFKVAEEVLRQHGMLEEAEV